MHRDESTGSVVEEFHLISAEWREHVTGFHFFAGSAVNYLKNSRHKLVFFLLSFFEFFFFVKQVETRRDRKREMIIPTIAVKMLLIIISTLHIGVLIISIKVFGKVVSGQVLSCPI